MKSNRLKQKQFKKTFLNRSTSQDFVGQIDVAVLKKSKKQKFNFNCQMTRFSLSEKSKNQKCMNEK